MGLGHSYIKANVKFNVNRVDNMVIQAVCLLDTLDKDINTFCRRVRYCKFKLSIVFTFWGVLYETTFKIVQSGKNSNSYLLYREKSQNNGEVPLLE